MKRDVRIRGETISLGQLLKLEGMIDTGAQVKAFLSTVPVWVNGEREARRGRKLNVDDVVRVGEMELRVTSEDLDIRRPELEDGQRVSFVWNGGIQDHGRHRATAVRAERTSIAKEAVMDWTLEVVVLPVSDVDRSVAFYRDQVGFNLDHHTQNEHMNVAQLTPPGSGCSIVIGDLPAQNQMPPGSMKALQLVVADAAAARRELLDRGVEASELSVITDADGGTFFGFSDPDGNSWAVQEIKARAHKPLMPRDHVGLGEWAGRAG